MSKGNYYAKHAVALKRDLKAAVPRDVLRELHELEPARHFLVLARHLLVVAACVAALWQSRWPLLWVPATLLLGGTFLGFTVLLHEKVHDNIFRRRRPVLTRLLGYLYAVPCGMSQTQFKHWHLDHHAELGHDEDDPKRAHLTPKRNKRWYKALYCSPYLFWIYARASKQELRGYPEEARKQIVQERLIAIGFHLALLSGLLALAGFWLTLRVYLIPLFFGFPLAFTINRLGQHYCIDPTRPAHWSSLVSGNVFWRFAFLWANFHLEHHYYPRVPFYKLTRLHRTLKPFYAQEGIKNRTYGELLWGWFVLNREAHTNWDLPAAGTSADQARAGATSA